MAGPRSLRTQTEAHWRDEFEVTDEDLDLVTGVILDSGQPQPVEALASAVMLRRIQQEREAVARQATSGEVYQPRGTYEVGQSLVFSALDFVRGEVVGRREGTNPKYGTFDVVRVAFEDGSEREFAAGLDIAHPLNRPTEELIGGGDPDLSDADIVSAYDAYASGKLQLALGEREEFVEFSDRWFLRELLPEITVGHLNLAEAAIDVAGHPLAAAEMLRDLEVGTGTEAAQLFALNSALAQDERFDNVGSPERPVWYLRALEPEALHSPPAVLENGIGAVSGEYVGLTMLDLVEAIGDELDEVPSAIARESQSVECVVTFPHLHAGTLPFPGQFLEGLAASDAAYLSIDLVDENRDERFQAWVVPALRYIAGLEAWYQRVGMVVGGQVTLRRSQDLGTFSIAVEPARDMGSNWVRSAQVTDGELHLQLRPPRGLNVRVGTDADAFIDVPEPEAIAEFMASEEQQAVSIGDLVRAAFHHLAGLTGSGFAHAKAIHSVANLIHRTGAVPVFAELTRQACFDPLGQGLWAYDRALDGQVYETPDDMRERPLSSRDNVLRDQAVPYSGR